MFRLLQRTVHRECTNYGNSISSSNNNTSRRRSNTKSFNRSISMSISISVLACCMCLGVSVGAVVFGMHKCVHISLALYLFSPLRHSIYLAAVSANVRRFSLMHPNVHRFSVYIHDVLKCRKLI